MPTIGKIRFLVIIFFLSLNLFISRTWAAEDNHVLNLNPLTGVLIGRSEEFLFKYKNSDQYVSELLWDLKPLFYLGLGLEYCPGKPFERDSFFAAGSVKIGLPLKTGIMEDRDWDNKYEDYLTKYSRHDAFSQNAILADISAGYSWYLGDKFVLGAFGEFSYMYYSWMAENGYYQYAKSNEEWDDSIPKINIYGPAIRYAQNWFILSPGMFMKIKLSDNFLLEGNFRYSPLIFCADRDDHLFQDEFGEGQLFFGYFYFGHYIDGGARLIYSPVTNLDLSLSLSYRYITGMRDKTYYATTGAGASGHTFENYEGGAGFSALDINLAVKIRVFGF